MDKNNNSNNNKLSAFLITGSMDKDISNFKYLAKECINRMKNHVDDFDEKIINHEIPVY